VHAIETAVHLVLDVIHTKGTERTFNGGSSGTRWHRRENVGPRISGWNFWIGRCGLWGVSLHWLGKVLGEPTLDDSSNHILDIPCFYGTATHDGAALRTGLFAVDVSTFSSIRLLINVEPVDKTAIT